MHTLLSICVTSTLLLPFCWGTTTPDYAEVTPTTDYQDYTFDYDGDTSINYDQYEVLQKSDTKHSVRQAPNEAPTLSHGYYAILLALMVQQFCQRT